MSRPGYYMIGDDEDEQSSLLGKAQKFVKGGRRASLTLCVGCFLFVLGMVLGASLESATLSAVQTRLSLAFNFEGEYTTSFDSSRASFDPAHFVTGPPTNTFRGTSACAIGLLSTRLTRRVVFSSRKSTT